MLLYIGTQECLTKYRGVEQLEARRAHNPEVVGSSPASATIRMCDLDEQDCRIKIPGQTTGDFAISYNFTTPIAFWPRAAFCALRHIAHD